MKYLVLLGDGMADRPVAQLNNKTPLEVAKKPNIDRLARLGTVGLVQTIPSGFKPGSDVANLSVMGYPPQKYYSGRSPLEALSIGINMSETDVAMRCNLVTLSEGADPIMQDYSAGEITTAEASELIAAVQARLGSDKFHFYSGVSYRHCLIIANGSTAVDLTPPHDISGKKIAEYLPKGDISAELTALILESAKILKNHPINLKRIAEGKNPATNIWLWGAGKKPLLDNFYEKYGIRGAVISAVDLLKGIAKGAGMYSPMVDGATGTLATNWVGKAQKAIECYQNGYDYVYMHIEAPDECGHQGDVLGKVSAIEHLDTMLKTLWDYLESDGGDYTIAVLPDHFTPLCIRTHSSEPVPFAMYKSDRPANCGANYTEKSAANGSFLKEGQDIIKLMLER